MQRVIAVGVVVLGLVNAGAWAQQAVPAVHVDGPAPAFEVATVKPPDPKVRIMIYPPGMKQQTLLPGTARLLVARAYGKLANYKVRVVGGPDWIDNDRYLVDGKIPEEMFAKMQTMTAMEKEQQVNLMLRTLLDERFKLKVHVETREMPIYELVALKDGPKMDALKPIDGGGGGGMSWGKGEVRAGGTLEEIFQLPPFGLQGRPVVNKTGLTGSYRVNLKWNPPSMPGANVAAVQGTAEDEAQESIFTVVQEQLGMKLVPAKGPTEILVIDHIEVPTEN